MKKNMQISIAKPCHEKWSSFTPTARGGFCSSCEKEVIDFTSWSEERIKTYFKNASGNMCGRFRQEQLKVYEDEKTYATLLGWLPVFFTGMLLLFSSQQSKAQGTIKPKPPTEQYEPEKRIPGDDHGKATIENPGSSKILCNDVELISGQYTVVPKLKWYSPRRWNLLVEKWFVRTQTMEVESQTIKAVPNPNEFTTLPATSSIIKVPLQ